MRLGASRAAGYAAMASSSECVLPAARDDEDVGRGGLGDGGGEIGAGARAGEREVDHARAVGDGVAHALGHRRHVTGGVGAEHLDRHDPRAPGEARDADAVVAARGDDARDVRAVAVVVRRVAVVVDEVCAVDVVDEAVAVVVDAVARHLARVGPQVGHQVAMRQVHAGVDHRHGDVAARDARPRRGSAHRPVPLQRPLVDELGVGSSRG